MWTHLKRFFLAGSLAEKQLYPAMDQKVRFRPYQAADREACIAIYRANEPGRFPEGHIEAFQGYLDRADKTLIVAEIDQRIVGYGGLVLGAPNVAVLCYGIVDPEFQGQKIGTTLTLLRFAQLADHSGGVFFVIFAVPTSTPFYQRFGFVNGGDWIAENGLKYPLATVHLWTWSLRSIRTILERRGIRVDGELTLHQSTDTRCEVKAGKFGQRILEFLPIAGAGDPAAKSQLSPEDESG